MTNKTTEWEEEFDKRFGWLRGIARADDMSPEITIKSFLKETVEKAERRGAERAVEVMGTATGVNAIPETDDYANGWNDCRKAAWKARQEQLEAAKKIN